MTTIPCLLKLKEKIGVFLSKQTRVNLSSAWCTLYLYLLVEKKRGREFYFLLPILFLCLLNTLLFDLFKIYLQLPKSAVPDPHNLELWLKVHNHYSLLSYFFMAFVKASNLFFTGWINFKCVSLQVDGEIRQKGSTKDMIFKIPYLISHISSIMTLFEGDVILTGIAVHFPSNKNTNILYKLIFLGASRYYDVLA